jgi:hypothetical protein
MRPLPRDVALLFVHALNPFGFAWNLRGNEDNVDINRNWIDFDAAAPDNPLYDKLHDVLCPARIDSRSLNAAAGAYGVLAERHGTWRMDDALTRGQYAHADGIHFGGHAPSWSRRILHGALPGMLRHVRQVALIDWHSGPVGDGELIFLCYSAPGTQAYQTAQAWWGRDSLDPDAIDRLWSGGRPSRHGLVFDGISDLLGRTALAGGVVEFCSARQQTGPAGALRVSMLERWLRFEGGQTSPEAKKFRKEIRSNYAPERASFREKAIDNALHVFDITLSGLAAQAGGEIQYSG